MSVNPNPPAPAAPAPVSPWSTPPAKPDPMAAVDQDLAAMRDRIAAAQVAAQAAAEAPASGAPASAEVVTAEVLIQYQNPVTGKWWPMEAVLPVRIPSGASVTAAEAVLTSVTERLLEPLRVAGASGNAMAVVARRGRSVLVGHAQVNP